MAGAGHNSGETLSVADDMLRSGYERWLRLEEEKAAIGEDLKELFAELKGHGFTPKALRESFRRVRNIDDADQQEHDAIVDLYVSSLTGARCAPAHAREIIEEFGDEKPAGADRNRPVSHVVAGVVDGLGADGQAVALEPAAPEVDTPIPAGSHGPAAGLADQGDGFAALPTRQVEAEGPEGGTTGQDAPAAEPDAVASASEPVHRTMSMTPIEPREAGGLKGFGFTVNFDEKPVPAKPQPNPRCQRLTPDCKHAFNQHGVTCSTCGSAWLIEQRKKAVA